MLTLRTLFLVPVLAALMGCTPMATVPPGGGAAPSPWAEAGPPADAAPLNSGPHLVIPATGGPPVLGIPLGGNLYLPVTGEGPIVGIPIGG